ncbi:MAG: hypothetical protein ACREAB_08785 [Blastocatellia bacterium]
MKTMRLLCCFFIALSSLSTRMWPSASGQNAKEQSAEKINVAEFLGECREVSVKKIEESRRQLENYTFKRRKIRRERSRNGASDEHSEVFEVYPPPFRRSRGGRRFKTSVLIEKDSKPVSPERIEKERLKVGRSLERFERESNPITEPLVVKPDSLTWGNFSVIINMPFTSKRVDFRGDELFDKCDFDHPYRENVAGRNTIALRFHPRPEAVFGETAKYLSNFVGVIWVDEADKFIFRLAAWPQGVKFDLNDSDHMLENAAVAIDYTRTKEGLWFCRMGRMNAVKYPKALLWLTDDFSLEWFDYKLYKVDSEKEKLSVPEKK